MALTEAEKLIALYNSLKDKRSPRESVWDKIVDYILPSLEVLMMQDTSDRGTRNTKRYSGAGILAGQTFADGFFGYHVGPSINWLNLRLKSNRRSRRIEKEKNVIAWLLHAGEHLYEVFGATNFYDALSSYFERGPAFGFAVISTSEDIENKQPNYMIQHPGEIYLAENNFGKVDTVIRKTKLEGQQAIRKFGKDMLSETLVRNSEKNPHTLYDFINFMYPTSYEDIVKIKFMNKPYTSTWLEMIGRNQGKPTIVKKTGSTQKFYHAWRFRPGSTPYGYGPGEDALVEILQDDTLVKDMLLAAEKHVNPPLNVPAEMKGKTDLFPMGHNYYGDPNRIIVPVNHGVNYPIGVDREDRIKSIIERHFKIPFLTLLAQQEGVQPKTELEIIELQGEKSAMLTRPLSKLNDEGLEPLVQWTLELEMRAGRIDDPPEVLEGEEIEVEFAGPLAQAQKKLHRISSIRQALEINSQIFQAQPSTMDRINWDKTVEYVNRAVNLPPDLMNDDEAVALIREQRAQAEMQQAALDDMQKVATATESMAKADKSTGGKVTEALEEGGGNADK